MFKNFKMKLSLGIVGLPNVGKSTLFNALTKQSIPAENYPFCTIDPNVGIVPVHDERLYQIAQIAKPQEIIPAVVEFVDIAGLVRGASKGEGLGNQFLANIREVAGIIHVVRAFEDTNISHVENSVDPIRDIELIHTELILKDLETISKKISELESKSRSDKKYIEILNYFQKLNEHLNSFNLAIDYPLSDKNEINEIRKNLFLLTDKPIIFVVNTADPNSNLVQEIKKFVKDKTVLPMDIKLEADLAMLDDHAKKSFMQDLGISQTGLEILTKKAYDTLNLISFFTQGPKEVRAWTIKRGTNAQLASGVIHTDFIKNFISVEVCKFSDFINYTGWNNAKENGKVRYQGREYIVEDGDIMLIHHNS
ncbi:MAG: ribosome-binding ATPase YchF [Candidatus Dojkabacteria bacterium]|nr:MAG: ribosome-binding ATPase YchF [Candidatus Dojkabacteria bacterium]